MTVLGYLGMGFLGFWVGVIITCIILVKKNGAQYAEIQEEVRNERYASSEETDNEEDTEDASDDSNSDSAVLHDDEKAEA